MASQKDNKSSEKMSFEANIIKIGSLNILKIPKTVSDKLPSRGMVMVNGTLNNYDFQTPLEPDGRGGHWMKIDETMEPFTKLKVGDSVQLTIEPTKNWPEPKVPSDFKSVLDSDKKVQAIWKSLTPISRWDWLRWIRATKNPETRKKRIDVTCSKLRSGKRQACCFNRSECTDPSVSDKGQLLS